VGGLAVAPGLADLIIFPLYVVMMLISSAQWIERAMDRLFHPRIRRLLATLWAFAWIGVAFLLLLPMPIEAPDRSDLVVHFLLFGGMAFAAIGFSRRVGQLGGLALLTITASIALEFAQKLVPYRTFDLTDAAANALGATFGFALAVLVLALWLRPADPEFATGEGA
jgi:VanZ family protein